MSRDADSDRTPEEDARIAEEALEQGDLRHAIRHIGAAIAAGPREEWIAILDRILDAADDPLALVPFDENGENYFGDVSVRAHACRRQGRDAEALRLILGVLAAQPSAPFETWAGAWATPDLVRELGPEAAARFVGHLVAAFPDPVLEDPWTAARLRDLAPVAEKVAAPFPDHDVLLCFRSMLRRKVGRRDDAVADADRACRIRPTWMSHIALAMACKAKGDIDRAAAEFRRAIPLEEDTNTARRDLASMLCEHGRYEEGIREYEELLRLQPDYPGAKAERAFAQWRKTGHPKWVRELEALAPTDETARELFAWATRKPEPYLNYIPEPGDATINVLRQLAGKAVGGLQNLSLSSIESPSSRLALDLVSGSPVRATIAQIPSPDPRVPRRPVDFMLWKYEGTDPSPAVPAPDPPVARSIARIAAMPFDRKIWDRAARALAAELGPSQVVQILAAMVHPSEPPAGTPWWAWIHQLQVAAAMVLARLDSGWEGSTRRKALISLALGPADWTVSASLAVLPDIARETPESREEILGVFRELLRDVPSPGACGYLEALTWCMPRLPNLTEEDRAQLSERSKEFDPPPAPRPYSFDAEPGRPVPPAMFLFVLIAAGVVLLLLLRC